MNDLSRYDGCSLIPLNGKKPVGSWKKYQTEHSTQEEHNEWFGTHNVGIVTGRISDLIVVDFDDKNAAREWFKNHISVIHVIVETRRGVHFYFRCPDVEVRNSTGTPDIRGEGGYVVAPPSEVANHIYRFVEGFADMSRRAVYQPSWFGRAQDQPKTIANVSDRSQRIVRAREYMKKVEPAVSGNRGHDRTLYAAACLVQKFELTIEESWSIFLEWNERCQPPWKTAELRRKLEEAQRLHKA